MQKKYLFTTLVLALFVSACSTQKVFQSRTGFFKSYDGIQKHAASDSRFFEVMDDSNLSRYTKILIPDIKVIPNALSSTALDNELYTQVSAYATAAYRKNIIKHSANYKVVDVAQKDTVIMQIAISMVEVHPDDSHWDNLSSLPFVLDASTYSAYEEGNARILVEARISDAMSQKLLARSMRIVMEEEVRLHDPKQLQFKDFHTALDKWLHDALVKQ